MARKTRSTGEAMAVLERNRPTLISIARYLATLLILKNGSTYTRPVRDWMEQLGFIEKYGYPGLKDFWLGAVFRSKLFEKTTKKVSYTDPKQNIHEREVHVWRLRDPVFARKWADDWYSKWERNPR